MKYFIILHLLITLYTIFLIIKLKNNETQKKVKRTNKKKKVLYSSKGRNPTVVERLGMEQTSLFVNEANYDKETRLQPDQSTQDK